SCAPSSRISTACCASSTPRSGRSWTRSPGSRTAPPSPPCSAILSSTRWCAAAARICRGGDGPRQRWSGAGGRRGWPAWAVRQWRERSAAALVEAGGTPQSAASALRTWLASPARVDRGLLAELEALRSEGLGVFVLTNGTDRVPEELEELGLTAFLGDGGRFLLNTADLGAAKPDHEAFVRAHARIEQELCASVRPDEIAFLDDSARHVRGAARFGWHAVHHRPARDRFRRSDPDPSEGGAGLP